MGATFSPALHSGDCDAHAGDSTSAMHTVINVKPAKRLRIEGVFFVCIPDCIVAKRNALKSFLAKRDVRGAILPRT